MGQGASWKMFALYVPEADENVTAVFQRLMTFCLMATNVGRAVVPPLTHSAHVFAVSFTALVMTFSEIVPPGISSTSMPMVSLDAYHVGRTTSAITFFSTREPWPRTLIPIGLV